MKILVETKKIIIRFKTQPYFHTSLASVTDQISAFIPLNLQDPTLLSYSWFISQLFELFVDCFKYLPEIFKMQEGF